MKGTIRTQKYTKGNASAQEGIPKNDGILSLTMGEAGHPNNKDTRTGNQSARYFDPLADSEPGQTADRTQFLAALREKNPEVLGSLHRDIFPIYEAIWKQIESCRTPEGIQEVKEQCERRWGPGVTFARDYNDISRWGMVRAANAEYRSFPEVAHLGCALAQWASRFFLIEPARQGMQAGLSNLQKTEYNLVSPSKPAFMVSDDETPLQTRRPESTMPVQELVPAEWMLNVALKTMASWAETGSDFELDWSDPVPGITPMVGVIPPRPFEFEPWQPQLESRADYQDRYLNASVGQLDAYLDVLEKRAQAIGLEQERLRRRPRADRQAGVPVNREFEWLVLWQTAGVTLVEIQQMYRFPNSTGYSALYDESSIRKAIHSTAERVGLLLRK
jgi:hypothetical protein